MSRTLLRAVGRHWPWGLTAALVAVAAGVYLIPDDPAPDGRDRDDPAIAVEAGAVERGALADIRRLDGQLEALARYDAAPKVGGQIRSIAVRMGDTVERGEVIARLDRQEVAQEVAEAEAALEVARAELAETRAALESARRDLARTRELREREIASAAELEAAEAQVAAEESREQLAEARIAQRRASLSAAQVRLSFTEIRADWEEGGDERVVGERYVDPGATVSANEPIVSLLDLSGLRAVTHVTEREYGLLQRGQEAELQVAAYPGETFTAEVKRLAPLFRASTRQARVELTVPNPEGVLRPGMFARLSVEVDRLEDVATVPAEAVVRRGDQHVVFRIDEETVEGETLTRAHQVPVRIRLREGGRVAVAPVEPEASLGERVVTVGQHRIGETAEVTVVGADEDLAEAL